MYVLYIATLADIPIVICISVCMCMGVSVIYMCACTHTHTTHTRCTHSWTYSICAHIHAHVILLCCSEDTMGKCSGLVNPQPQTQALSQAAILLRERMRKVGSCITGYDRLKDTGELLVHLGSTSLSCCGEGKVC